MEKPPAVEVLLGIVDCLAMRPAAEDSYEVTFSDDDSGKPLDVPKKGRTRAAEGVCYCFSSNIFVFIPDGFGVPSHQHDYKSILQAPKLFSGLHFYVSKCMNNDYRRHLLDLIAAGGGLVLKEENSSLDWRCLRGDSSPRPYFVYDGGHTGEFSASSLRAEIKEARKHAAAGARVISHLTVMDAIAAYDAEVLDQKGCIRAGRVHGSVVSFASDP